MLKVAAACAIVVLLACGEGRSAEVPAKVTEPTSQAEVATSVVAEAPAAGAEQIDDRGAREMRARENGWAVQQLMRARSSEVWRCFNDVAACPIWRYQVAYEIDEEGRVSNVEVDFEWHAQEPEANKARVTLCLAGIVASHRYDPPPPKRIRVRAPSHAEYVDDACWGVK